MDVLRQQVFDFLSTSKNVSSALKPIKPGAVIQVDVEGHFTWSIRKLPQSIRVESLSKEECQIRFILNIEAARHLLAQKDLSIPEFGVETIKQIALGNIQVKVNTSLVKLMRFGYLNILIEAGAPVWSQLSEYGIKNLSKLNQAISRLRH